MNGILVTSLFILVGSLYPGCSMMTMGAAGKPATDQEARIGREAVSPPHRDEILRLLVDARDALKAIHTDGYETDIPPDAKPLLINLKHLLRDLMGEALAPEGRNVSAQQIEARAIVDLMSAGVAVSDPECVAVDAHYADNGYDYGEVHRVTVKRLDLCFVDLIAVTTTIGVCCGEDTSLYLFKHDGRQWKLCLQQESHNYDQINGAQGLFQYGVSFPDQQGDFFVLVANVNPWCSSNWQSLRYAVLRPGSIPDEPRVIFSEEHSIFLDDSPSFRLIARSNGFRLAFHDESFMDLSNEGIEVDWDDPKSERMMQYAVHGDRVILVSDKAASAK
jgi:hypothetical protein